MRIRESSGLIVLVVALATTATAVGQRARLAKVDPAITRVIEAQFAGWAEVARTKQPPPTTVYARHAMLAMTGTDVSPQVTKFTELESKWTVFGPARITGHKVRDVRAQIAGDGRSAWLSFAAKVGDGRSAWLSFAAKVGVDGLNGRATWELRASQLLFKTEHGWEVGAGAWSRGQPDRALAKAVAASTLPALEPIMNDNVGTRDVLAALDRFVASGFEGTAPSRADVVAIGAAPAELAVGGKAVVAAYQQRWVGKVRRDGAAWAVTAPSGTTACVTANVHVERGPPGATYEVPTRLFVVFDKDADGEWAPVHAHLASPAPAA